MFYLPYLDVIIDPTPLNLCSLQITPLQKYLFFDFCQSFFIHLLRFKVSLAKV